MSLATKLGKPSDKSSDRSIDINWSRETGGGADPLQDSVPHGINSQANPGLVRGRWLVIGEWALFGLLAIHFGMRSMPWAWRTLNTDFPDHFLAASLIHEHYDTSRIYEWIWFERQKDHRGIDQRIVNLTPSTAFSSLVVYPLTGMPALAAKHWWLIFNFGLLIATTVLLRNLTELSWRRIALLSALSVPLRINFITGQYYVLLLFLLTLACYLYLRQRRFLAGVMVGIASGLKIFPVIYLLYFLRKRDMKALAGGVVAILGAAFVSVLVFGWEANRTYLFQVLPATLRGEAMAPYALKIASLASLLHRLFVFEPQLNPHPAMDAAWLFPVVHPLLQMAVMAPVLLLAIPGESCSRRLRLEWVVILLASLTISTSPQSYQFTLLILPACVILDMLQEKKPYLSLAILLPLYLAAGYFSGTDLAVDGWRAFLGVPRLYVLILFCILAYALLITQRPPESSQRDRYLWVSALGVLVVLSASAGLRRQRGIYEDYRWRIPTPKEAYMAVQPATEDNTVLFVAMTDGYHLAEQRDGTTQFSNTRHDDQLGIAPAGGERWVEQAGSESTIVSTLAGRNRIERAESPVASSDGRWLAFLREDHGRAQMWVRALDQPGNADELVSPPALNVFESSFLPSGELIFAAASDGRPSLFLTDRMRNPAGDVHSFDTQETRYPSVSPDGHWLAYSQLQDGNWNLWLRDLNNGRKERLTNAACNTVEPAWASDSKTLVYASDCGRGLWFFALSRRRVVP